MTKYDVIPFEDFFIPSAFLGEDENTCTDINMPYPISGNYTVRTKPLYHEDRSPDATFRGSVRPLDANIGSLLVRNDNDKPLGVVGAQYVTTQNLDVYNAMINALKPVLPGVALESAFLTEYIERDGAFARFDLDLPRYSCTIEQENGSETTLNLLVSVIVPHGANSPRMLAMAKDSQCDNLIMLREATPPESRRTEGYDYGHLTRPFIADVRQFDDHARTMRKWAKKPMSETEFHRLLRRNGFSTMNQSKLLEHFRSEVPVRGKTAWNAVSTLSAYATHDDLFYVRNSANVDNTMEALTKRLYQVSKIMGSPTFSEVLS